MKCNISLIENGLLDYNYNCFIEDLIECSGYTSVRDRKDSTNQNVWHEKTFGDRRYHIEFQTNQEEYNYLKQKSGCGYSVSLVDESTL